MFWKFNHQLSPQIDTVLFKEDTTLNEVLDQENILQELKSQNKKLIEFITRADILNQLVSLVIEEPSDEIEEHEKYRRPNIACEVLTTDIPIVNERLSEKALLTKLYSFLERDPPLNPLLASFFSRTLSMLICRKADQHWYSYQFTCLQFLDFLKTKENSLNLLLKHLDTSAIMDLTLKLITQIEGNDMQKNLISWIESEGLIENIIALFDPKVDEGRHYNAAQLLCDTIRKCREINERNEPDPILSSIQSPEMIKKLLEHMLNGEHVESSIVGGISVLLTLLEPTPSEQNNRRGLYNNLEDSGSGEPPPPPNPALHSIVTAIIPFLPALHDLLLNPPKKPPVKLACGTIEPPLGNTRLTVIKLIASLIATNTPEVNEALDRLNTVHVLLDLFFHYTWNNFLHSQVDKCLAFALNSFGQECSQNPLIHNIFIKCRLLQRILEAWEENETEQSKNGGKRRGYMGHLTNIANSVIKQGDCLGDFINENIDENTLNSWHNYVETTLQPINDLHQQFLGGTHPAHTSNKDEDNDFKDANFPADPSLSENFNEFSSAATLNSDFIESFAFDLNRDMNNSLEDNADRSDGKDIRALMFKKICSQRKDFSDLEAGMDEDLWEEGPSNMWTWNNTEDFSSSSDEENEKASSNPSKEKVEPSLITPVPVLEQVNPWLETNKNEETTNQVEEGWADFTAFVNQFESPADARPKDVDDKSASSGFGDSQNKENCTDGVSTVKNVNTNDLVLEDVVADEELIDNFRFLSIQGLISEKKINPNEVNENNTDVKNQEEPNVVEQETSRSQSTVHGQDPV